MTIMKLFFMLPFLHLLLFIGKIDGKLKRSFLNPLDTIFQGTCIRKTNTYICAGNNIKVGLTRSDESCESACLRTKGCVGWTRKAASGQCNLKSDDSCIGTSTNWTTGYECKHYQGKEPRFEMSRTLNSTVSGSGSNDNAEEEETNMNAV